MILQSPISTEGLTYRHRRYKVRLALLEVETSRYHNGAKIGDAGLYDKDHGNNCQIGEGLGGQLGAQLDKNYAPY